MLDRGVWRGILDIVGYVYFLMNLMRSVAMYKPVLSIPLQKAGNLEEQVDYEFVDGVTPTSWPDGLFFIFKVIVIVLVCSRYRRGRSETHTSKCSFFNAKVPCDDGFTTHDGFLD